MMEPYKWKKENIGPKKKDYNKPKKCPVSGCNATVIKLKRYLTGSSHAIKEAEEINILCQRARREKTSIGQQIAGKMQRDFDKVESLPSSNSDSTYDTIKEHLDGATFWDEREESDLDDCSSSNYTEIESSSTSNSKELKNEAEDLETF